MKTFIYLLGSGPGVRHPHLHPSCAMFILRTNFCCVNNKAKCQEQEQLGFVAQFSVSKGIMLFIFNVKVLDFRKLVAYKYLHARKHAPMQRLHSSSTNNNPQQIFCLNQQSSVQFL